MKIILVPNYIEDAINAKLDAAIAECPGAEAGRGELYSQIFRYFDECGEIPNFNLTKKES